MLERKDVVYSLHMFLDDSVVTFDFRHVCIGIKDDSLQVGVCPHKSLCFDKLVPSIGVFAVIIATACVAGFVLGGRLHFSAISGMVIAHVGN